MLHTSEYVADTGQSADISSQVSAIKDWFKGTRFLLRRRAEGLSQEQRGLIEDLAETNERVYRGWLLVDQLRATYRAPDPE